MSPALAGGFLTTAPPGKSSFTSSDVSIDISAFFWLVFTRYFFFHHFTLNFLYPYICKVLVVNSVKLGFALFMEIDNHYISGEFISLHLT